MQEFCPQTTAEPRFKAGIAPATAVSGDLGRRRIWRGGPVAAKRSGSIPGKSGRVILAMTQSEAETTGAAAPAIARAQPPRRRRAAGARAVAALILREMATTYGRSPGGYLWALLDPIAGLLVMSLVFSLLVRSPPLGESFALFYATGFLPFTIYNDIAHKVSTSIRFSRPLLAYPQVTYVDTLVSRFILNTATNLVVFIIIIAGIVWIYDLNIYLRIERIAQGLAMSAALGLGVGSLEAYLNSMFPLWERIWAIANRPLFLISGVFFLVDSLDSQHRDILLYNPLVHITSEVRAGIYMTYDAEFVSPVYVYTIAVICLLFGMLLLHRYHKDMATEGA